MVEDGALVRGFFGKLKTCGSFAKKLVPNGAGRWILAGNDELYEAQRGNYTDPLKELENIAKKQKDVGLYEESIYSMRRRYEEMSLSVEQLLKEEEIDEEKLAEINMEQQLLLDRIGEMERKLDKERKAIQGQLAGIKEDINNAEAGAKRALELLDRLEAERAEARAGLLAYAAVLPGFAGQVPDTR